MPVFTLKTHNQTNYKCLPRRTLHLSDKNVEDALSFWTDASSGIKTNVNPSGHMKNPCSLVTKYTAGFSLRIEVAGEDHKITGESGHSEKKLTSGFYRLMKFSRKIPCSNRRILRSPMLNEHPVLYKKCQAFMVEVLFP